MKIVGPIPNHVLTKMNREDRPKGNSGLTLDEVNEKIEARTERELHTQITSWLRLQNVRFIGHSQMNKRTRRTPGEPDAIFVVRNWRNEPVPMAFEIKTKFGVLSTEQMMVMDEMSRDGWHCYCVHSLKEAIDNFNYHTKGEA